MAWSCIPLDPLVDTEIGFKPGRDDEIREVASPSIR